jgi:glucose/arabinose dehydrogenase
MKKIVALAVGLAFIAWVWINLEERGGGEPSPAMTPPQRGEAPPDSVLVDGLEIPWALDFLPDGGIILTERPGRLRLVTADGRLMPEPLATIPDVAHVGEGGLLGIAVHPNFSSNGFIYIYYTYSLGEGAELGNKVVRYRKTGRTAVPDTVIVDGIPGAPIHNGGRIKFGPDGMLYIATGDAARPHLSQDPRSLAGKILRLTDAGAVPGDNPFHGSPIYSLGHRNPQGLAWDAYGQLWATEHGSRGLDEVNLIQAGGNYGWPVAEGGESAANMRAPVLHSGADTWAPSGAAFYDGSLFFAGLRGQSLYEVVIAENSTTLRRHLHGKYGRMREAVLGPDNLLYLLTSNLDGRGRPLPGGDKIIKVDPALL